MKPALAMAFTGAVFLAGGVLLAGDFGSWIGQSNPVPAAPQNAIGSLMTSNMQRSPEPTRTASLKTVNLKIENMWCASCPYIVRRALEKTPGVIKASVSLGDKAAVVIYDGSTTEVASLIAATTEMGYPSRVAEE